LAQCDVLPRSKEVLCQRNRLAAGSSSLTGYRRGIGREFPLRLARERAGIALGAKPEESTEDLPGRASKVAEEVETRGPWVFSGVDVLLGANVENIVDRTVEAFGRLDLPSHIGITINSCSAL
jgi:NAD(P)-dependent dehydrogenase (short-subunit alcohol dehydrogenase family)